MSFFHNGILIRLFDNFRSAPRNMKHYKAWIFSIFTMSNTPPQTWSTSVWDCGANTCTI